MANFDIKILLLDLNNDVYNELKPKVERESIELLHLTSIDEAKKLINEDELVYLIIISAEIEDSIELVYTSKSTDLNRPIIVIGPKQHLMRSEFVETGIHIYHSLPVNTSELSTQCINLLTLYHAKKNSKSQNDVFKTLSLALDVRDPYTNGHGERVAIYSVALYDELGLRDYEEREALRVGCIIHDVGKIGTPDEILKSNKRLNMEEYAVIKEHPSDGVRICSKIISDPKVVDIIEHHHEKLDGSGYPHGLKGDAISRGVQISTVADVFDALTSDRIYRTRNTSEEAFGIMEDFFLKDGKINNEYYQVFKTLVTGGKFKHIKE